jgi:hypothetical protein
VSILTLGYLEKPTDSPFLQTLKRLSDETDGVFFDATNEVLPAGMQSNPFDFLEKGGHFSVPVSHNFWGKRTVAVTLGMREGSPLELATEVDFPDVRTRVETVRDFAKRYQWQLVGGVSALILILVATFVIRRRRKQDPETVVEYAYLREMDGSGTSYVMRKTAISIGRASANDIQLRNDSVSAHHAEIHRRREGSFYIVDLASSNGVYVNDARINQTELSDGDLVELGEVRLRFSRPNS